LSGEEGELVVGGGRLGGCWRGPLATATIDEDHPEAGGVDAI